MALRDLPYDRKTKTAALSPGPVLRAEPFLGDLSVETLLNAGPGVVDLHDDVSPMLGDRDADPALALGRRRGIEPVVDQVAEERDQVLTGEGASAHDRVIAHPQLDSALRRDRRLGQQQRAQHGIAHALEEGFRQFLVHARCLGDELHGLLATSHLDKARDRVQPIGKLVSLRAKRVGEAVNTHALAETGKLDRVAEGGHVPDFATTGVDRPTATDEDTITREQHFVLVLELA